MTNVNRQGEVWVFAEQEAGKLAEVSLELLGKGRELAEKLGVPLGAVLLGKGVEGLAARLTAYGADKVYLVEHRLLDQYQAATYRRVFCKLIEEYRPQVILYGATAMGRGSMRSSFRLTGSASRQQAQTEPSKSGK